jgi:hypothetical protein
LGGGGVLSGVSWLGSPVGVFRLVPFPISSSCAGVTVFGCCGGAAVWCVVILSVFVMALVMLVAEIAVCVFGVTCGCVGCGSVGDGGGVAFEASSTAVAVFVSAGSGLVGDVCDGVAAVLRACLRGDGLLLGCAEKVS